MTLGENLQRLRRAKGLSQDEVAQRLYLSRQSVSKWENNQTEPGVENLKALARLYGVTVDVLVGAAETLKGLSAPPDSTYLRLLKLRTGVLAVVLVCMLVNSEQFNLLLLLSECLAPCALAMFLGYQIRKKWVWVLLMGAECFFMVEIAVILGTGAPFMGVLTLLLEGCWLWRLCQTDIQRMFYKEGVIP